MTTIAEIQSAICRRFKITHAELIGDGHSPSLSHPRQLAYYICRRVTGRSLPFIARFFANRNHSTLLFGIAAAQRRIDADPVWQGHHKAVMAYLDAQEVETPSRPASDTEWLPVDRRAEYHFWVRSKNLTRSEAKALMLTGAMP